MSEIDNSAKVLIAKADKTIAANLAAIALFVLRYGAAFALGAYLF